MFIARFLGSLDYHSWLATTDYSGGLALSFYHSQRNREPPWGDVVPSVPSCLEAARGTVTPYGLSLTATAAALSVSKQSVLRGVATGAHLLATKGWGAADLLPS
jgi:hypothetical protein